MDRHPGIKSDDTGADNRSELAEGRSVSGNEKRDQRIAITMGVAACALAVIGPALGLHLIVADVGDPSPDVRRCAFGIWAVANLVGLLLSHQGRTRAAHYHPHGPRETILLWWDAGLVVCQAVGWSSLAILAHLIGR